MEEERKQALGAGHHITGSGHAYTGRLHQAMEESESALTIRRSADDVLQQSLSLSFTGLIKN